MTSSEQTPATREQPSAGPADWLRREWYLARVDWSLENLVSGSERKRIISSLQDDIAAESSRHGLHNTLAGLGDPRALAHSYADGTTRPRPKWVSGIVAAGVVLLLYWIVFFSYTLGMLAVVEQSEMGEAQSRFLLIDVGVFASESGIGIGWGGGGAWVLVPLIIVSVVFLLVSRAWRVFIRGVRTG